MANRKAAAQAEDKTQEPAAVTEVPASNERQPGDEPEKKAKRPFKPVQGFTQRFRGPLKYRKFTDANLRVIAFKFNLPADEKPPQQVLDIMHAHLKDNEGQETGLKFQTTRTHGKIWTLPNDVEGRTLADRIDYELSQLAEKMEGQSLPAL